MLEIDGLVAFVVFGLWLYCLYDVITTEESLIRNLPKFAWLMIVIILFDIGALAWLLLGRPQGWQLAGPGRGTQANRPTTRDKQTVLDDPDLEGLSPIVREREERARLRMWEEQLRRREEELRRQQDGGDAID